MAPATAATPDPSDPPMETITEDEWQVLLARGVLPGLRDRDTRFADLPEVARQLIRISRLAAGR